MLVIIHFAGGHGNKLVEIQISFNVYIIYVFFSSFPRDPIKIVLYCFQVDANIIRDEEDHNSTVTVNDLEVNDNVKLIDANEVDEENDREERLFFNRRPVRVRPRLPPVNPAAALLIPAIPTLVGVLQ